MTITERKHCKKEMFKLFLKREHNIPLFVVVICYIFYKKSIFLINFRKWHRVETLMAITDAVNDVAFAPNLGR